MKQIWMSVSYYFWFFVIRPIKCIYNLVFKREYIADDERNRQIIEFCAKVTNDFDYQASNPVEHWLEKEWRTDFDSMAVKLRESADDTVPNDMNITFEQYRPIIASQVLIDVMEHVRVKAA